MTKHLTNELFFRKLLAGDLTPHSHPALVQAFVVDAVSKIADATASKVAEDLDTPFMSGAAWLNTAKAIQTALNAQYGRV